LAALVLVSPQYWTPPLFQDSTLEPCYSWRTHWMCSCLSELLHRHNSTENAWLDFSSFFLDQLKFADDHRIQSSICAILDVGYAYYHHQRRVPARVPGPVIEQYKGWLRESQMLIKTYRHIGRISPQWASNHYGLR
jgi:hypothetical protein